MERLDATTTLVGSLARCFFENARGALEAVVTVVFPAWVFLLVLVLLAVLLLVLLAAAAAARLQYTRRLRSHSTRKPRSRAFPLAATPWTAALFVSSRP